MEKKLNVLFLLPSLGIGGAERQVVDLVNGLSEEKFNIYLVTFEKLFNLLENLDREKVTYIHCPREYKFDFSVTRKIAHVIDREDIDIVHWTNQISLLFGFFAKFRAKKKVKLIGALHTTINRSFMVELFDWFLYVPLMMSSKAIITVCENQKIHWARKYPWLSHRLVTIHNGIDTEKFKDTFSDHEKTEYREALGIGGDEFTVAILSSFRVEKGHEYAFYALKRLRNHGKNIRLLLIGDGQRKSYLQSLAKDLSISKNVIWLGWQKDPRRYISICDTLLMPSCSETFSMAILEALSMGKSVIATDIGGTSEMVIDGQNGFLVKRRDVDSIVSSLLKLIDNVDLKKKMSANARESMKNRYSLSKMIKSTEKLILGIASA